MYNQTTAVFHRFEAFMHKSIVICKNYVKRTRYFWTFLCFLVEWYVSCFVNVLVYGIQSRAVNF